MQQPPQEFIQRPLPPQNVSFVQQVPQGYVATRPQGAPEFVNQQFVQVQQPVVVSNQQKPVISQAPIASYNPPVQVKQ